MNGRADAASLILLQGINKAFRDHHVLRDVDLSIKAGEIITLVGPNGAGKSTLVRIALGLERPDSGTVNRAEGLRIGYMPQKVQVDDILPLTVRRFLTLHPEANARTLEVALAETKITHLLDHPVQKVSGGEMQRILLTRALIGGPQLLVLDEPVQGVDVSGQSELYALIDTIRKRMGCGVLMISHDLHMVMAATDQVICLNHHVCCSGSPQAVGGHPAFKALFGQSAESMALYTHDHNHDHDLHGDIIHDHTGPS